MKIVTKKRVLAAVGLLVAGAAALAWANRSHEPKAAPLKYRASVVDTGSITHTVTATGTINPMALVNVGSQVSGTVVELKADFNDRVKEGQVLLKLDPTIFNAQVGQARASVASAQASLRLAQASFERNKQLVAQNSSRASHWTSRAANSTSPAPTSRWRTPSSNARWPT